MLFHVRHSRVISPHCIYVEFFGVFELFSPVHTKTPKQWKYGHVACLTEHVLYNVWHHHIRNSSFVRTKTISWHFYKNSTLGTVKMPEIPFTCGRNAKLRKESLFSKLPGYVWTRPKWVYEACVLSISNIYDQSSCCIWTWNSDYSYYHSSCITWNYSRIIV